MGLTHSQARVYLNIAKMGESEIKSISKVTSVARTDLYRIMPELEQLGLVEKRIGKPVIYKATDIITGFSILQKRKEHDYFEYSRKINTLMDKSKNIANIKANLSFDDFDFSVISSGPLLEKQFSTLIIGSKMCDFVFPTKGLTVLLRSYYKSIRLSLKKGSNIRVLVNQNNCNVLSRTLSYRLQKLRETPSFQIKFIDIPINFGVVIFDNARADMNISANSVVPSLYSTNHAFVESAKTLFATLWELGNENASSLSGQTT